jgi:hypothetical protein
VSGSDDAEERCAIAVANGMRPADIGAKRAAAVCPVRGVS